MPERDCVQAMRGLHQAWELGQPLGHFLARGECKLEKIPMLVREMRRLEPEAMDYLNVRRARRSERPGKISLVIDVFAAAASD